jgi:hypothetical protein
MLNFELDDAQCEKLKIWQAEQNIKGIQIQKEQIKTDDDAYDTYKMMWDMGSVYGGTVGGVYTYMFIQTSIGVIAKVHNSITDDEFDLTDYEMF